MSRLLSALLSLALLVLLTAAGCGDDKALPDDFGGRVGGGGDGGADDIICLANNCTEDFHCKDCTGNKTVCKKDEGRCIACGPAAGGRACPPKYACTKYGDCVPEGTTCTEDGAGVATQACSTNAQCAACGPNFRICDPGAKKCTSCTPGDLSQCQKTDFCKDNKCTPKCPAVCGSDNDCTQCGAGARGARTCVRGKCVQCNPESGTGCPQGQSCTARGVCQVICGKGGVTAAGPRCEADNDCAGCRATKNCDLPINGGFGKCAVPAPGCSELGKGLFTMPEPFDKVTNLCSGDADCKNVDVEYNVGKELREFTGVSFLGDASIKYGMNVCASIDIIGSKSCGVCVPCRKDADCKSIDMTALGGQLAGGLGKALVAKTMDTVFGRSDKKIHFYCENLGTYGLCLPCGNPLSRCGDDPPPASGPCNHDICTRGERLGVQCNECTAKVCEKDSYCCTTAWDAECIRKTESLCSKYPSCLGQSCSNKADGWYCSEELDPVTKSRGRGAYKCVKGSQTEGNPCNQTEKFCHPQGDDWKKSAVLGSDQRPQCFTTATPSPL